MDELEQLIRGSEKAQGSKPVYNPGNLRPVGASSGFQQFKTPEEGIQAADRNLKAYGDKGINTLRGVISRWAPPSENDTEAYIKNVSQRIGLNPDAPIDLSDPVQRHVISGAMFTHEQGSKNLFKSSKPAGDELEQLILGGGKEPPKTKEAPKFSQVTKELQNIKPKETFGEFVGQKALGIGEAGLSALTGALAAPAGAVGGIYETLTSGKFGTPEGIEQGKKRAAEIQQALTYAPRTQAGQEILGAVGQAAEASKIPPLLAPEAAGFAPLVPAAKAQLQNQFQRMTAPPPVATQAISTPPAPATNVNIPPAQRQAIQANMTAKPGMLPAQDLATMQAQFEAKRAAPIQPAKPDLVGVGSAQVQPEKLRVERAKELPVPIELSKDQATRDPADVRFARETAKDPVLGQALQAKYADDNLKIQKNLDHFIESSGADYTGAAPGEVGQLLVNAIGPYQKARKTAITAAYDTARSAGEMDAPLPISRLADFVEKNQSAAKNAPVISAVENEIKRLAKNGEITINDLEEVRKMATVLAQDSGPNSHYGRQAIRIIDKMTEGKGGELYQRARRLNADYMREFEDTPVVKNILAMKRGTTQRAVAIEDLVEKSMLKGPKSDVVQLFRTLQNAGPEGQQMINEMRGYVAQRIKDEATKGVGRDINGLPYVSTHGLNKMIVDLDRSGKLELLFGKQGAEQYRTLNEVTKDLQTVPVGTTNPSGSSSSFIAALSEMGVLGTTTGVPLPVMWAGKQALNKYKTTQKLNKIRDFIDYGKEK